MQALTIRRVVTAMAVVAIAGCGGATMVPLQEPGRAASVNPAAVAPAPTSRAGHVEAALPSPSQRLSLAPPSPAGSPPVALTFMIRPVSAAGVTGTIAVTVSNGVAHYHGVVTGLAPRSGHTIHDHAGTCGGSLSSRHLAVLVTAVADGRGVLSFDATLPASDFGARRIVIVYESARATVIAGCAAL